MDLLEAFIFAIGRVICHQQPDRSFFWDGRQLPVCARCTGLYVSGVAGLALWFAIKVGRRWRAMSWHPRAAMPVLVVASVPTALSIASGATGVWDGSNITRALLAIPLGATAGAIVAAVMTKDLR